MCLMLAGALVPLRAAWAVAAGAVARAGPVFAGPYTNPFGLADVGLYSSPTFADLDADGDLDAFVGEKNGATVYFENTGTAVSPAFVGPSVNPVGLDDVGLYSTPSFADLDADGDLDAFVGDYWGATVYFENEGSAVSPGFGASLANPFGLAGVGWHSSPSFADLDKDGDLDAFVGEANGSTVYFFENTGTAVSPAFGASSADPFGLADVGYHSSPAFADLDGDGDLDAFVGEYFGATVYFENTGSAVSPAFGGSSANPFGLMGVGLDSSPSFADLDGDGDLDAFVGESSGNTLYFRNDATPGVPHFLRAVTNPFGLVWVGHYSDPSLADIDADGDFDALVGNVSGSLMLFENLGDAIGPAFAAPVTLADVGFDATPTFADLDADGDLDICAGERYGSTFFLENTGTAIEAHFASASENPFGLIDVGWYASPSFADLDGDGDLDAFIGKLDGAIVSLQNIGDAVNPTFAYPLAVGDVGGCASPAWADTDKDGDLDGILGNSDGNFLYFENTRTAASPAFADAVTDPFGLSDVGEYSTPVFADLDGDGDLDAFSGNGSGDTLYFEGGVRTGLPVAVVE